MKKNNNKAKKKVVTAEVHDYDNLDVSEVIKGQKPITFESLGLRLPETQPTQVVSIRVPTQLLNEIRAISSQNDVPYQGLIKMYLAEAVSRAKNKKRVS